MNPKSKFLILIFALALPFAAGFIGSLATTPAIPTWYASLTKPSFSPPNWIFAPVWSILYFTIGLSLYLVLTTRTKTSKRLAYKVFATQLALNSLWSVLFFGYRNPLLAFFEIILLSFTILLNIITFRKINSLAALLLVPYLLWVSFATILNLAIILLN